MEVSSDMSWEVYKLTHFIRQCHWYYRHVFSFYMASLSPLVPYDHINTCDCSLIFMIFFLNQEKYRWVFCRALQTQAWCGKCRAASSTRPSHSAHTSQSRACELKAWNWSTCCGVTLPLGTSLDFASSHCITRKGNSLFSPQTGWSGNSRRQRATRWTW